jgi:hypothetical protein
MTGPTKTFSGRHDRCWSPLRKDENEPDFVNEWFCLAGTRWSPELSSSTTRWVSCTSKRRSCSSHDFEMGSLERLYRASATHLEPRSRAGATPTTTRAAQHQLTTRASATLASNRASAKTHRLPRHSIETAESETLRNVRRRKRRHYRSTAEHCCAALRTTSLALRALTRSANPDRQCGGARRSSTRMYTMSSGTSTHGDDRRVSSVR